MLRILIALFALTGFTPLLAADFELRAPLICTFGQDCFIQQYANHGTGTDTQDYQCQQQTYQGHDGTDFRVVGNIPIKVVAPADGIVIGTRNTVADHLVLNETDRQAVTDTECGNGVALRHANGWESQLCHLKQGSVTVHVGDVVQAGQTLGVVGYSGLAAFRHVHLTVRHNHQVYDPFTGHALSETTACSAHTTDNLWDNATRSALAYQQGVLIDAGFTDHAPNSEELELNTVSPASANSAMLVVYGRAINMKQGDVLKARVDGPLLMNGQIPPLERHRALQLIVIGKKSTGQPWPSGTYTATVELVRAGKVISQLNKHLVLP